MRMLSAWLGVAALCLVPSIASADVLKPYVVFMLDTSGSMNAATSSGPPSCGGRDNRLNHAKCAINRITNSYGDMVFALGRFRMDAGGPMPLMSGQSCDANGNVSGSGADVCTANGIGCSMGDGGGEMLTGLVNGGNNAAAVWTDFQCGTCGGAGTALSAQPEIWAADHNTPLGGFMASAARYWQGLENSTGGAVIWPSTSPGYDPIRNDPTKTLFLPTGCDPSPTCSTNCCTEQCRSYITIMLTDGDETCSGNAETPITGMLSTIVDNRRYRIETKVIGFGVTPGDTDIERYARAGNGGIDLPGINEGYYANDEASLQLALSQILADAIKVESCNNLDDDCDSKIDEDFKPPLMVPGLGGSCTNGQLGLCARSGSYVCSADGSGLDCTAPAVTPGSEGTQCNGEDEDCDGKIDEGLNCVPCPAVGETCNGLDDDCDGVPDQTCRCSNDPTIKCDQVGNECGVGTCVCTPIVRDCANTVPGVGSCPGTQQCIGANTWTPCAGQTPTVEDCDGQDDDCDGVCDGLQTGCSEVNGACTPNNPSSCPQTDSPGDPGHYTMPDAAETSCADAIDNDLDGFVNDGCAANGAAETGASCSNAMDDDGDGAINDGCPVPALPIAQNVCHPGSRLCPQQCGSSNSYGTCSGEVLPSATDPCNGLDDDCDNKIDENFTPADCSTNCGVGQTKCVNGALQCDSMPAMNDTTCNNVDDDCDGKIDENWTCAAPINGMCPCGTGLVCDGLQKCVNGAVVCQGNPIGTESCNCLDEDCDTKVDEGTVCPTGSTCTNCQCAFPCAQSEFPCPLGKKCENTFCVNDPCYGVTCPAVNGNAQTCIPKPGFPNEPQCVATCSVTTCTNNLICYGPTGECRPDDCTTFPERCNTDQACIVGSNGLGQCVSNPCAGVTCSSDKYCIGGTCVSSCADVTCPTGQRCRQGVCETDPCGEPCPFGYACNDVTGQCIEDPCKVRQCPQGQWCNPNDGQCEDDPCVANEIECPNEGEICRGGTCLDPEDLRPDAAGAFHVTVGGGGGCSTTGGTSGLLVGLALLLTRRRRRVRVARDGGAQ